MLKRLIESDPATISRTVVVSLTSIGPIGELLRSHGVRVHAMGMSSVWHFPMTLWRLVWHIRRYQPRIVHTWMYHADLLGGLAARLAGCRRIVWSIRGTTIPQGMLSVTYWLVRVCAICSHIIPRCIICCAKSAEAAHIELGYAAHKMAVIPNGFDFSVYDPVAIASREARRALGFNDDDIVIGAVGRFDPLKDFKNFVAAAAELAKKRGNVKFLMVGKNLDWSNQVLLEWIGDKGLVERFRLVGEQANVPYFLSAMDIFCLSSASEAFPNVLVEAMAIGLPCVATRAGDAADILGADDFAVPVRDSNALSDALWRMCELPPDKRRLLGERGAMEVRAVYGINAILQKYEEAYAETTTK